MQRPRRIFLMLVIILALAGYQKAGSTRLIPSQAPAAPVTGRFVVFEGFMRAA